MEHCPRRAPYRQQTEGKIERCHQTLWNRILLEYYSCPAIPNGKSRPSSNIIIMTAIMRASESHAS